MTDIRIVEFIQTSVNEGRLFTSTSLTDLLSLITLQCSHFTIKVMVLFHSTFNFFRHKQYSIYWILPPLAHGATVAQLPGCPIQQMYKTCNVAGYQQCEPPAVTHTDHNSQTGLVALILHTPLVRCLQGIPLWVPLHLYKITKTRKTYMYKTWKTYKICNDTAGSS